MKKKVELIKELANGYSIQSKASNQFWVVLIVICVFILTTEIHLLEESHLINMPFSLGQISLPVFSQLNIIIVSTLTIAFTSSMIQVIRTRTLIQEVINNKKNKYVKGIHIQDYLDSILSPTYNRVAPISQYLLGKNQFYHQQKKSVSKLKKFIATLLYVFLKLLTYLLLYFVPILAILKSFSEITFYKIDTFIPMWLLLMFTIFAITSILILFIGDIKYLLKVILRIGK